MAPSEIKSEVPDFTGTKLPPIMTSSEIKSEAPDSTVDDLLRLERYFARSENLVVCGGCVPVDIYRGKVAVVRVTTATTTDIVIPKGYKGSGEHIPVAAFRAAHQETGLRLSTIPPQAAAEDAHLQARGRQRLSLAAPRRP